MVCGIVPLVSADGLLYKRIRVLSPHDIFRVFFGAHQAERASKMDDMKHDTTSNHDHRSIPDLS